MMMPERTEKASNNLQINCSQKARHCPGGKYKKYRGVNKCWGCRFATWINTDEPYGPRKYRRTKLC